MGQKGFTIIEIILSIVILGIIAGIGLPIIAEIGESQIIANRRNDLAESGRLAIDRLVREIRRIKDDTSVVTANSTVFQFIDIDDNTISFSLSSGVLRRTYNGTANDLAGDAASFNISYYDQSGSLISSPAVSPSATDIRRVRLNLGLEISGSEMNFFCDVSPRRLSGGY